MSSPRLLSLTAPLRRRVFDSIISCSVGSDTIKVVSFVYVRRLRRLTANNILGFPFGRRVRFELPPNDLAGEELVGRRGMQAASGDGRARLGEIGWFVFAVGFLNRAAIDQ